MTLQQREDADFLDLIGALEGVLRDAYEAVRAADARWVNAAGIENLGLWPETVRIIRAAHELKARA